MEEKKQQQKNIHFRLLCNSYAIGGLIGPNGNIIKSLQSSTSSKISVDVSGPSVPHRVVHIIAPRSLTRTLTLDGVTVTVSPAQEALSRVYDRVLEAEEEYNSYYYGGGGGDGGGDGEKYVKCSVVVGRGMASAVMGTDGNIVSRIVRQSKAYVHILPVEFAPPGVEFGDDLVKISGRPLCVKKALVMISQYLQQRVIDKEKKDPNATFSRSLDQSRNTGTHNAKVVFKLIADHTAAGWVIGHKGQKVKSIEEETSASIHFHPTDAGSFDRLVTISAFENKDSQYSLAQNAIVRVFNELAKAEERNTTNARLLILPYQYNWLGGEEVSIISTIQNATGATLKIIELDDSFIAAAADEKVLQIEGDYPDVQIALFQVTWALRERFFDASLPKDSLPDSLPLLPHKLFNLPSEGNKIPALTDKMKDCRVSKENNGRFPPINPHSQFSAESSSTPSSGSPVDSGTANGGSNFWSGDKTFVVTNKTLEIAVRENVFSAVYGENGSNLSRLRLISGATVEVQDPISGSDGKVIISGTSEQTLVAQSLLQAFLMSA